MSRGFSKNGRFGEAEAEAEEEEQQDALPIDRIRSRLATLAVARAERRRRVQLPLFAFASLAITFGACVFSADVTSPLSLPFSFHWGAAIGLAGGMALDLSAFPGDVLLIRGALGMFGFVNLASLFYYVPQLMALPRDFAIARGESAGAREIATLWLNALTVGLALAINVAGIAVAAALIAGSVIGRISPLRLNTLNLQVFCVWCVVSSLCYATAAARAAIDPARERRPESWTPRSELISVLVVLSIECASMGLSGLLNRRLQSHVHAFLAGRGVGVSAAAGLAELMNGVKADDVLRDARASFRAVSIDDLTYEMLVPTQRDEQPMPRQWLSTVGLRQSMAARRTPDVHVVEEASTHVSRTEAFETEASHGEPPDRTVQLAPARLANPPFAPRTASPTVPRHVIARPVELGQCDAFVSHSWHDPPDVKWKALQAWGADFRTVHGRAPLLWFDSLCIDQSNVAAQLPSLPVYLTSCSTLLILHGPTYLHRLWFAGQRTRAGAQASASHTTLTACAARMPAFRKIGA